MRRPPLIQFHVSPELYQRLKRLRSERNVNLSAWLRTLVTRQLDRELGPESETVTPTPSPEPKTDPGPLPGWSPSKLEEGEWGASWMGDTRKLPDDLVGCSIEVTTRHGDSWIATVVEVIQHEADYVLVRDSGKG